MAKIKDLPTIYNGPIDWGIRNEYEEFKALLFNAFKVTNTSYPEEQRIKELLINSNYIGYDGIIKAWAQATPLDGRNINNLPIKGSFIYPNGKEYPVPLSYEPNEEGYYLIKGLPGALTYSDIIYSHTDIMYQCDIAIMQNLNAIKAPYFIVVEDDDTRFSIEHAIQQQQKGVPVIVVGKNIYDNFKGVELNTPIIFDQIYEFRQKVRASLLNKISTLTSNRDKKERVQTAEIGATVGECEDYIYALIDNVNRQFKSYGLPQRLEINSSLEELYTATTAATEAPETNTTEVET